MPADDPSGTLDTNVTDLRAAPFEAAWLVRKPGQSSPHWQDYLPTADEPGSANLIYLLIQIDIECRVKAGLSALLTERYFDHPRLRRPDAPLDAERQVELIRWEYQQRWQNGQRAQRSEYQAAFPEHAGALGDLKPRSNCPRCKKEIILEETPLTLHCPACESQAAQSTLPPDGGSSGGSVPGLDLRGYELLERLGGGGMGDVFRAGDPALGRDLAVKVMAASLQGHPEAERRFLREARVTGSLQHPGVVPIHNLGRLADGRLHYTMRLVRGRTLSDILKERADKSENLPELLAIFEKVCQAVAYAHSKRVIHRDLKPANVMVGRFGEVQVMDWGLAKLLAPGDEPADGEAPTDGIGTRIHTEGADTPSGQTRMGREMGTPAYMPPEQALGEWDVVDERADVFALGAILCEILTGRPPYSGRDGMEALRKAKRGDWSEASARLTACGADAVLVSLCRECLASGRESRPRDAEAVARRVAAYQAEVQERLRRAELERTEAVVKAREERKRRRLAVLLAAMVLVLVGGGVAALGWQQRQDALKRLGVEAALAKVVALEQQARWAEARAVLEEAESRLGEAAAPDLRQHLEQGRCDLELVARLDAIRLKRATILEGRIDTATADEEYRAAFREAGLGEIGEETDAVAVRIGNSAVRGTLVAALDDWAGCTEGTRREWVWEVARKADPDPRRDRVRNAKVWNDGEALERLVTDQVADLSPQLLAVAGIRLSSMGRDAGPFLRKAQERYPGDFWVYFALGYALVLKQRPEEAVGYYRAALALRPGTIAVHISLGVALAGKGRPDEAILEYQKAIATDPKFALAHVALGVALAGKGRPEEAIAEYRKAVVADPKFAFAHSSLGNALRDTGHLDEALVAIQEAVALAPNSAIVHNDLGNALRNKGRLDEALAEYQKAITLEPKYAHTHNGLGNALADKGRLDEAAASYRKAIELDPKYAYPRNGLGNVLRAKQDTPGAVAAYRKAIELDPRYALAYNGLGGVLWESDRLGEAIDCYRKAVLLDPKYVNAHNGLGLALSDSGRLDEAIVEYHKALELDPRDATAHNNLGLALWKKGRRTEAIACHRKAIELDPRYVQAHGALGRALLQDGQFDSARQSTRHALDLLTPKDRLYQPVLRQLRQCEQMIALEKRLTTLEKGGAKPVDASELAGLTQLFQYKKCPVAAVRFFADAFAAKRELADDLQGGHRYNAACFATLAAAGQGEDADKLDNKERARLRRRAVDWLRADLTRWSKQVESAQTVALPVVRQTLQHWQKDTDLATVRDATALRRLSEDERAAWQALWRDVDELLKRASERKTKP